MEQHRVEAAVLWQMEQMGGGLQGPGSWIAAAGGQLQCCQRWARKAAHVTVMAGRSACQRRCSEMMCQDTTDMRHGTSGTAAACHPAGD
jgi:hypothetical protein